MNYESSGHSLDKASVIEFNSNLESKLADLEIEVEWCQVDPQTYKPSNDEWQAAIQEYKTQAPFNRNHDLAAVDLIKRKRGKTVRKLKDAEAFFLTSDRGLYKFCQIELDHNHRGTVGEVVLDQILTSIIWLKDPSVDISLETLISAHASDLLVNRRVWKKFYEELEALNKQGKVDDESISALLFHNYIGDVLGEYTGYQLDEIDSTFVLKQAELAAAARETEFEEQKVVILAEQTQYTHRIEEMGKRHEKDIQSAQDRAYSEGKQRAEEEKGQETQRIHDRIVEQAQKRAARWIIFLNWYTVFVGLLALAFYVGIPLRYEGHLPGFKGLLENGAAVITVGGWFTGGSLFDLRKRLTHCLMKHFENYFSQVEGSHYLGFPSSE